MSNPEEKQPKTNGLSTDPFQRLASLKNTRDLSLGGVKHSKKVFAPNLNVIRKKGPAANTREQKKEDRGRKERRNDRNKNIRNGPNIIKSSGVFAEGLGSAERHSSRVSYGRDSDPTPVLRKPTIRVKDVIKIDKELEEQRIRSVVGDSGLGDEDVCEDFKKTLELDAPVKLPIDDGVNVQIKAPAKVKQEVIVKQEPDDDVSVEEKPLPDVKKEVFEDTEIANLLQSSQPTLILLQLPDTLPGRGGSADDDAPRRKQHNNEPSTSADDGPADKPADDRCYLSSLEEGRIGMLQVHRSGRVSLVLGDAKLEVCLGTKPSFHQEVVSMAVDDRSRSARLVSLGPLQHKLCAVPDWEAMFSDMPK